jgi:hypothetical protein
MPPPEREQLSLIDRIERALVLLGFLIERDGDVYLPLYEKFEIELEDLKKNLVFQTRVAEREQSKLGAIVPGRSGYSPPKPLTSRG